MMKEIPTSIKRVDDVVELAMPLITANGDGGIHGKQESLHGRIHGFGERGIPANGANIKSAIGIRSAQRTPDSVQITLLRPENLHEGWVFVETGLNEIRRKLQVPPDWRSQDVYASLRTNNAQCYIVTRGPRALGFFAVYKQMLPFSGRSELFVWAAYSIPLRERHPTDNVPEAVALSLDFLHNLKRQLGCVCLTFLTSHAGNGRAWKHLGFKPSFVSYRSE